MEGVYGYSTEVVLIVSEVNDEGRRLVQWFWNKLHARLMSPVKPDLPVTVYIEMIALEQ